MTTKEQTTRSEGRDEVEDTARPSPRDLILYIVIAILVAVIVYFLPDIFFSFYLAIPTAYFSSAMLHGLGLPLPFVVNWANAQVFVGNIPGHSYQIIKDCTGVQVIAVFAGLIFPLPRGTWRRKGLSMAVVSVILFVANVLRVVYEIWLVEMGILPWELAHYPMSFVLGVIGVFVLCLVAIWLLPGFIETYEDMLYYLFPPKNQGVAAGK
jgi:exosortase/archaeosortase family protein